MKKLIALFALVLTLSTAALAQADEFRTVQCAPVVNRVECRPVRVVRYPYHRVVVYRPAHRILVWNRFHHRWM